jgi:hypothetical protein
MEGVTPYKKMELHAEFDFRTAMNLERDISWLKKQRNQQKIKSFEKNCNEISFAKEIYKRKKN